MNIEIADVRLAFDLRGAGKDFLRQAGGRYGGFRPQGTSNPRFFFLVKFKKMGQEPFRPSITLSGNSLEISRGDFRCQADLKKKRGELSVNPSIYSFDSFLRVFLSFLLLRENGLLVHGAALSYGGRPFLLAGKSGSGKSTVSRLAAGKAAILSDELVPVRINGKSVTVFSSPFWGEMEGRGISFRKKLAGVFLLKKSKSNIRKKTGAGEFLPSFLRCVMNFSKDPALSEKAVKKSAALWKLLGPQKLCFSKDGPGFLKLL